MGFPFSNFDLPSFAAATVCWPVNLPIIAHSAVGKRSVCVSVCGRVCAAYKAKTAYSPCILAAVTHVKT